MKSFDNHIIMAPLNEELPPRQRTEAAIRLSELVMQIVTHVICHIIVDYQEQLKDERLSVAHAFLQRATSTHLCNHKLTTEGIVMEYQGQSFALHEEYKTMTLTRSVYEHLAMFYYLYEQPRNAEERDIIWKYWQINSKKNLLDYDAGGDTHIVEEQKEALWEIEKLRTEILSSAIGTQCHRKLDEWTKVGNAASGGSIRFSLKKGKYDVRRVSYSQAWKYLFKNEEMNLFYRHLSMHSHPVYQGLMQYQSQSLTDDGHDGLPLFFSSSFLARLCRLFLKQIPDGEAIVRNRFSHQEREVFYALTTSLRS